MPIRGLHSVESARAPPCTEPPNETIDSRTLLLLFCGPLPVPFLRQAATRCARASASRLHAPRHLRTRAPSHLRTRAPAHPRLRFPQARVTCTAAAGSLTLEFGALSVLTGDAKYEAVAKRAALAVWRYRSRHDLMGARSITHCLARTATHVRPCTHGQSRVAIHVWPSKRKLFAHGHVRTCDHSHRSQPRHPAHRSAHDAHPHAHTDSYTHASLLYLRSACRGFARMAHTLVS
eukprot:6177379-Pleurochrysis_carterae.AAC.4